ncbi:MAG: AAA family ATPase [Candidatus Aegiribacteria sp.]|nr:AAA family ATPase [Candidatus Aegiribacteria sp.]
MDTDEGTGAKYFISDKPIKTKSDDILNRSAFACQLARAIKHCPKETNQVIGLYGGWGTGKTSLINLVIEQLEEDEPSTPIVIYFNPWNWTESEVIQRKFFESIAKKMASEPSTEDIAKNICHLADMICGIDKRVEVLWNLVKLALGLSSSDSIEEIKHSISERIYKLDQKLLIVIDDIDRLSPEEVSEVFKLIKCNADFPNTVYLIAFQRNVIENHLAKNRYDGQQYLEKIVQVPFNIPHTPLDQVMGFLARHLNQMHERGLLGELFDKDRWSDLNLSGFRDFFQTLRDVKRFVSSASFHASLFQGDSCYEVNPIDLLGIEAIRVFAPEMYGRLKESRYFLTVEAFQDVQQSDKMQMKDFVNNILKTDQPYAKQVALFLFPVLKNYEDRPAGFQNVSIQMDLWFKDIRICHPDCFDRYFQLTIPSNQISHSLVTRLIDSVSDISKFEQVIYEIENRELLEQAIDRLRYYVKDIHSGTYPGFLMNLMYLGDRVSCIREEAFAQSSFSTLGWIFRTNLNDKRKDIRMRSNEVQHAFSNSSSVALMASVIIQEHYLRQKEEDHYLLNSNTLECIEKELLKRLQSISIKDKNRLLAIPALVSVLKFWFDSGGEEQLRDWVISIDSSKQNVLAVLNAFSTYVVTSGGDLTFSKRYSYIRIESLYRYFGDNWINNISSLGYNLEDENDGLIVAFQDSMDVYRKKADPDHPVFS